MAVSKAELEGDLREALRAGDSLKKNTLRMALTAIKLAEVDAKDELVAADIQRILQKEAKARRETIADAKTANREDLVETAQAELRILEAYLPGQLSDEEIRSLAKQVIEAEQAAGTDDMGRVMGPIMGKLKGSADGSRVSTIVRDLLSEI